MHSQDFENALAKIQRDNARGLSREQYAEFLNLHERKESTEDFSEDGLSFTERTNNRQKIMKIGAERRFLIQDFVSGHLLF